jgi:hypothetical protein
MSGGHFGWVKPAAVSLSALVMFMIVVLGAIGQPPLSGANIEWVIAFAIIFTVSMTIGTIGAGGVIEYTHPDWTRFRAWHYLLLGTSAASMFAADCFFFWWLFSSAAGAFSRWLFLIGALAAIGLGVLLAWYPLRVFAAMIQRSPALARRLPALARGPRRALWPHSRSAAPRDWVPHSTLWTLLAICVGIVAAIGYLGISAWYENASVPSMPALPAAPTDIHGGYLAIGDSYSAGEGLTPFADGTALDQCDRSANSQTPAYPTLLMQMLKLIPWQFHFAACSGATVHDVFHPSPPRSGVIVPPQVNLTADQGVGLVTLTIGGNNAIFPTVIRACMIEVSCFAQLFPPGGTDIELTATKIPQSPLSQWGPQTIKEIGAEDAALFTALRADFPSARIIVIGYPYLFPTTADPGLPFYPPVCASLLNRFAQPDRQSLRRLQDDLTNRTYEEAVAAGIEFVSPDAIWGQHVPCGAAGQYTNSVKPYLSFANPVNTGSFHPNAAGQQAFAALVACYLDANTQPPDPFLPGHPHVRQPPPASQLVSPAQLGLAAPPGEFTVPGAGTVAYC